MTRRAASRRRGHRGRDVLTGIIRWAAGMDGLDDLGVVDALQVYGCDAEVAVAELALDDDQRHALAREFDGMGVPELVLISNFHDRLAGELAHATDIFDLFISRPDPGVSAIYWTGERLDRGEVRAMKAIERLNPRAPGFAAAAIRLMVNQVRSVASRKRTVGRGVLTLDIPGSAIEAARSERFILHSSPEPDHVTFLYFAPGSEEPTVHGPTYVGEGAVMSNFQAWQASGSRLAQPPPDR
jgi:hypothetical protein